MQLILHLKQGMSGGESRTVAGDRFTIGRAAENDWTLADPEQHLSRQHCIIQRRADGYAVIDTSTNGIVVNSESAPLGRNRERQLDDGDRLAFGDYVLRIELKREPAAEEPSSDHAQWFDPTHVPKAEPKEGAGRIFDKTWIGDQKIGPSDHRRSSQTSRPDKRFQMPPEHRPVITDPMPMKAASLFDHDVEDRPVSVKSAQSEIAVEDVPTVSSEPLDDPFDQSDGKPGTDPTAMPDEIRSDPSPSGVFEDQASLSREMEATIGDRRLISAFLTGAGLSPDDLVIDDDEAFMRQAGTRFAEMIGGLIQLLNARSTIKNAARIERTTLGADNNNPLKFARSTGEGMLAVLQSPESGFLGPEAAVRDSFQNLQEHEMALLDAMQVAVRSLMQRFDPQNFEQMLEAENAFATLVTGGHNSKCWKTFKARYEEIASEAERDFLGAVGRDFAEAYERNVHRT